jgi:ABC-type antimicrobial peptide transport system permease subunit
MFAGTVGGGSGMLVPQAMIDAIAPVPDAAVELATFVGVDLADDADSNARGRIEERLGELDIFGYPPIIYSDAVRPPEILEATSTRSVPTVVAATLAAVAALALGIIVWGATQSRRHELAVLRALGFRPNQVRWSIRIQSLMVTLTALTIGVPLGIIAGRVLWRTFAGQLGVVPDPTSAAATIAVVVAIALLLALIAAELPARRATATHPAANLRAE